ncbi:MAG: MarR family transcriptional regulator [Flavobacteriales bacterium]|nr:MarR family transcriptional regulator [Flavobacteriales bacterium]
MKFEDEIKQVTPFPTEQQKAIVNLMYTGNILVDRSIKILKPFNINEQHYNILRILKGRHPEAMCPGEIKEVLLNKRGDLTRLLDKLDKMGVVVRGTNPENRRMINILLNNKGVKLLDKIKAQMEVLRIHEKSITEKEAKQLNTILDKIRG